jgi:DNA-directed RNA polymerase specialized sigma24 family protein
VVPNYVPTDDGVRRMNAAVREEVSAADTTDASQGVAPVLERLVPAAVAGDREARDLLLAEIQPLVQRYCRGRLGRSEGVIGSADDVAQDVCLAVISALPNYEIKGLSFRAFVYGIAAHKVTDTFRAAGRNRADPVADVPDGPGVLDGAEQQALREEQAADWATCSTSSLTAARVLVLRIAVGLSAEGPRRRGLHPRRRPGRAWAFDRRGVHGGARPSSEDPDDRPTTRHPPSPKAPAGSRTRYRGCATTPGN